MNTTTINLPMDQIKTFCQRWKIADLAVFGSSLRNDFSPSSDIDLLAKFADHADWSLFDHAQMELELIEMLGREVDLLTQRSVEFSRNPIRKQEILASARSVYHAA